METTIYYIGIIEYDNGQSNGKAKVQCKLLIGGLLEVYVSSRKRGTRAAVGTKLKSSSKHRKSDLSDPGRGEVVDMEGVPWV